MLSSLVVLFVVIFCHTYSALGVSIEKHSCDKQSYEDGGICRIKLLADCSNRNFETRHACPDHAKCQSSLRSNGYVDEFCRCEYGYAISEDFKTCIPEVMHAQTCYKTDVLINAGHFKSDSCNKWAGLTCSHNGTCECKQREEDEHRIWDKNAQRCLTCDIFLKNSYWNAVELACKIRISQRCQMNEECPQSSACLEAWTNHSYCRCMDGYFSKDQGYGCLRVKQFGEKCNGPSEICAPGRNIDCRQGICGCSDPNVWIPTESRCVSCENHIENSYHEKESGSCKIRLDKNCERYPHLCGKNAQCLQNDRKGSCQCLDGHLPDVNQYGCLKLKNLGETCTGSEFCNPKSSLSCKNGRCGCNEGDEAWGRRQSEVWDNSTNQCRRLVGSDCWGRGGMESENECITNAECVDRTCRCRKGYNIDSEQKFCVGEFQSACVAPTDCDSRKRGLICNQAGECDCRNFFTYSARERKCVGLAGTPCSFLLEESKERMFGKWKKRGIPIEELETKWTAYVEEQAKRPCAENLKCTGNATCECVDGYKKMEDSKCVLLQQ